VHDPGVLRGGGVVSEEAQTVNNLFHTQGEKSKRKGDLEKEKKVFGGKEKQTKIEHNRDRL